MGNALDRHRIANRQGGRVDVFGDAASDFSKYFPLATGAVGEIVSTKLKDQADAAASAEGNQARQDANDARKKAAMAAADAIAEADVNGPLHKAAMQLDLAAKAAEAKAAYYAGGGAAGVAMPGASGGKGAHASGGSTDMSTYLKYGLIGVVVFGVGFVGYKLLAGRKHPMAGRR